MISKLEIYIILGLLVAVAAAFAAGDIHGHLAESRTVSARQSEADGKALKDALTQAQNLVQGDQSAKQASDAKFAALNKGIDNAIATLGKLPPVVLDARGCEHLSGDWGLRWNSVEHLSWGSPVGVSDGARDAVPAGVVQPPR